MKSFLNLLITLGIIAALVLIVIKVRNRPETGEVVFSIASESVEAVPVSAIELSVGRIDMHSVADGWVTVADADTPYSLLDLAADDRAALYALYEAPVGVYDQIRVEMASVAVGTEDGGVQALVPAETFVASATVRVTEDEMASVIVDFLADESLHPVEGGGYAFVPVAIVTSQSDAVVSIDAEDTVIVSSGYIETNQAYGMDIDGSVRANFRLNGAAVLEADDNGVLRIQGGGGDATSANTNNLLLGTVETTALRPRFEGAFRATLD